MIQKLIESTYWLRIFLSPVFIAILLIGILSSLSSFNWFFCLLIIPAIIVGIVIAERARKKYGASAYWSKPMNTPDLRETSETGQEQNPHP